MCSGGKQDARLLLLLIFLKPLGFGLAAGDAQHLPKQ